MQFKLHSIKDVLKITRIANVHFFDFPKDFVTVDDKHPFCELIYVSSGAVAVKSDDFNGMLAKNQFIIHAPNSMHSLSCPKNEQTTVIIIGFECDAEKLYFFAQKAIDLGENEVKQLAEIIKESRNVFAPPYDVPLYVMNKKKKQVFGNEQLLKNLLESFLIGLIRKYEYCEKNEHENLGFEISEIIKYVDNNFTEKTTIEQLSFIFRTNRSTLCKEFKKATGKTLTEYSNDKKVEYLKHLLLSTEQSIQEISERSGFSSVPNFYAFFKKHVGVTPIEFKKQLLEK